MKLFNKRNIIDALKTIGVMMVILMLCLFIGSAALGDGGVFNWILFFGFLFIYLIAAFMDGSIRGEGECRKGDMLLNQQAKTGIPLDDEEKSLMYSVKKGAVVALLAAIPGIILFVLSLITRDEVLLLRIITRVYYTPYMKLFPVDGAFNIITILVYAAGAFLYPLVYFVGYLNGPRQHKNVKEIIRKNDEDYKKGIRKRRKSTKKRRGWFG